MRNPQSLSAVQLLALLPRAVPGSFRLKCLLHTAGQGCPTPCSVSQLLNSNNTVLGSTFAAVLE